MEQKEIQNSCNKTKKTFFTIPNELISRKYNNEDTLPEYRTDFMRDRDRIMYATAFRRLAGKTQIYTVGADDHKRNRLTHTLEVSQIARTISAALGLNVDLTEAIALAHDFGHTPFGHAGEEMLHSLMIPNSEFVKNSPFLGQTQDKIEQRLEREQKDKMNTFTSMFGFKHNLQSVRVAATLEDSYRGDKNENIGLNLTNFTLYGIMTHSDLKYKDEKQFCPNYQNQYTDQMKIKNSSAVAWSLEAYIVRLADDVAQWHHDLEDAMRGYALPLEKICNTIKTALGDALTHSDRERMQNIHQNKGMDRKTIAELSHIVVNTLVNDIVATSKANLNTIEHELAGKTTTTEFFTNFDALNVSVERSKIITISNRICPDGFKETIKGAVHHSRNVERMNEKGKYIIRKLFEAYYAHPQQLPDGPILHMLVEVQNGKYPNIDEAKKVGIGAVRVDFEHIMRNPNIYTQALLMRRICDHIASMTDHYAIEEYNNLYG